MLTLLAIATMIVDHAGIVFFPDDITLRAIGRIAMPLFALSVGRNLAYTRDADAYRRRLLYLAIASQIPFVAALGEPWYQLNVVATFCVATWLIPAIENPTWRDPRWLILSIAPLVDYGIAGVATTIAGYYITRRGWSDDWSLAAVAGSVVALNPIGAAPFAAIGVAIFAATASIGAWRRADTAIARRSPRWLLYAVYPGHLALFALIASM